MDVKELIERCKAGDRQALDLLYLQARPRLLGICRQFATEEDTAEDLLHDAFVIILTSLNQLKEEDKLEAWMASIVRNVGYQYQRQLEKEQAAIRQLSQEARETTDASQMPDYDQLQSLVAQLPKGYQQIFRLSVFEGLSHQDIGQLLGIAPHSSSSQLSHAKRMLRLLIRQSWVLILLLIAVPAAIWEMLQKEKNEPQPLAAQRKASMPKPEPAVETPSDEPVYAAASPKPAMRPIVYQTEAVITPDTLPHEMTTDSTTYEYKEEPADTLPKRTQTSGETHEEPTYQPSAKPKPSASWDIRLAYNGQMGRSEDYPSHAAIGNGSFNAISNTGIPSEQTFDNWVAYNSYLNNNPAAAQDAETRSLIAIATQNSGIKGGVMEATHEHQLPITIQLMLSRQLTRHLSLETGLSYTHLTSTTRTGSRLAYVQERQRLQYLGIPLRLGWQWYRGSHMSLYGSAGAMLELPVGGNTAISHVSGGTATYKTDISLDVPCQWSMTLGLGLQYDFTPRLGIFLEPSLQYFFDDGSGLETYRTEHPLSITLPLGIRFRW